MKKVFASLTAAAALTMTAIPALAGGLTPAPVTPVLIQPAPEPEMDWSGAYGGLILGLGQGTYGNGTNFPGDGEGDWDGSLYGIALGYNFQNGRMVYGGELTYSGANIQGSENCVNPAFQCYGEISSIATLRGRIGYLVAPSTLIYGTAGFAMANLTFGTNNGMGVGGQQSRNVNGYVVGLGVEQAITDRLNFRGALLHYEFDGATYQTDVPYTNVGGDLNQLELGLVFRF
jgi:outer membrane immunogenic protein